MIYILVAGGVFNAVLVPQLVRSIHNDADRGSAFANRILTLAVLILAGVTIFLMVFTPWLLRLYLTSDYYSPEHADELRSVVFLTRLCLPQVFFYGMFVLVGQILNAHGRLVPMMWAPILNNAVAISMLLIYLGAWGRASISEQRTSFSTGQELMLGVGSTLGIALQFVVLLPYLRSTGLRVTPRFDFRGTGLTHTLRLATWTVLFVIANQITYLVVVRLAVASTIENPDGTGLTVYANSFLILMVPHSIITVTLTTALLPRIAAYAHEARLREIGNEVWSALRRALSLVLPFVIIMPFISMEIATTLFGWGEGDSSAGYGSTLAIFAPALGCFTIHYVMLRGFYALEQTRTAFFVQCIISLVNVSAAFAFVHWTSPSQTSSALAAAYLCAYAVGSLVSYFVLRSRLGGLATPASFQFFLKLVIALSAGAATTWLLRQLMLELVASSPDHPLQSFVVGAVAGGGGLCAVALVARPLRISEIIDATPGSRKRQR